MNWDHILRELLPPYVHRRLTRRHEEARKQALFRSFYGQFVGPGDLCFDVGANLGNRTRCFRMLGCRVVAIEPQARCLAALRAAFVADASVSIVGMAVGRSAGQGTLHVSPVHVLSSMSPDFIDSTRASGRFADVAWNAVESVTVTTLDALIQEFGKPKFLKIDVEGHELEVLSGLSAAIDAVSFEWTPELADSAIGCVQKLTELGDYEFNLSWGESMRFSRPAWRNAEGMIRVIEEFRGESLEFGDIYARLRAPDARASSQIATL